MSELTLSPELIETDAVTAKIDAVFEAQRANRIAIGKTDAGQRIKKLKAMRSWLWDNKQAIRDAIHADFRKPAAEVDITEFFVVTGEINHAIKHLRKWMRPQPISPTLAMIGSSASVRYEPRGLCLIISPWNFPLNLTLGPLVSAIAAGNCAVIKPSEYTPHTNSLVKRLIDDLFHESEVAMFEGEKEVAQALLDKPFDHVFFTGSPAVGKHIMAAAAKHLASVTLELGGKSPVIIHESASLDDTVAKLTWGKYFNAGQTCIAPDYVLVHESKHDDFVTKMAAKIRKTYGDGKEPQMATGDYARLINSRHYERVKHLMIDAVKNGATVRAGGTFDDDEKFIAPTLLSDVSLDSEIMHEEIFGPLMPVIPYTNLSEAIDLINSKPKPLSLYFFGRNNRAVDRILDETSAGGTVVNDNIIQFVHNNLPFGGVNNSGMGNSHGFYGFRAFSHERAVIKQIVGWSPMKLMYPPYTAGVQRIIDLATRYL